MIILYCYKTMTAFISPLTNADLFVNLVVTILSKLHIYRDLSDKMQTFSLIMWGPHREFSVPTSFEITVLIDLLDKMRTFSLIWGPRREFSVPTSFEITV